MRVRRATTSEVDAMFGLVTRKEYDRLACDYENDRWWWEKQVHALEERVTAGEKYRTQLETKNNSLAEDNLYLYEKKQSLEEQLAKATKEINDMRLKIMSLEAHWSGRTVEE